MVPEALRRLIRAVAATQLTVSLAIGGTALDVLWQRRHALESPIAIVDAQSDAAGRIRYRIADASTGGTLGKGTLPPRSFISSVSPNGESFAYVSEDPVVHVASTRSGVDVALAPLPSGFSMADNVWANTKTMYYTLKKRSNDCIDSSPVQLWRMDMGAAPERIHYERSYRLAGIGEQPRDNAGPLAQLWLLGASPDGRSALIGRQGLYMVSTSSHTRVTALRLPFGFELNGSQAALSPDGKTIAASLHQGSFPSDIWLIHTDHRQPQQLTAGVAPFVFPVWSRGGRAIAAYVERTSRTRTFRADSYLLDPYGHEAPRRLRTRDGASPVGFTPDGRILMTAFSSSSNRNVQLFDPRTNRSEVILTAKDVYLLAAHW